jgi:hypothetical protein
VLRENPVGSGQEKPEIVSCWPGCYQILSVIWRKDAPLSNWAVQGPAGAGGCRRRLFEFRTPEFVGRISRDVCEKACPSVGEWVRLFRVQLLNCTTRRAL